MSRLSMQFGQWLQSLTVEETPRTAEERALEVARLLRVDQTDLSDQDRTTYFDLYKIIVDSSEALVARRQQVNTFFLTINGVLLTALGFFIRAGGHDRLAAGGIVILGLAGGVLAGAWRSLLISFGQLNTGKFAVIHRMEALLPAEIFKAEWEALDQGRNPQIYRSFTARELWVPNACIALYVIAVLVSGTLALGFWTLPE